MGNILLNEEKVKVEQLDFYVYIKDTNQKSKKTDQ